MPTSQRIAGTVSRTADHSAIDVIRHDIHPSDRTSATREFSLVLPSSVAFQYTTDPDEPPREVMMRNVGSYWHIFSYRLGGGELLDGMVPGFGELTLLDVLDAATSLNVEVDKSITDNTVVHVLRAETPYGRCTLWCDPSIGNLPRRILIEKGAGSQHYGQPLPHPPAKLPPGAISSRPNAALSDVMILVDHIQYEQFDEQYLPVSAEIQRTESYDNGMQTYYGAHHARSELNVNPDFKAIGAFTLNVPDGTPVINFDFQGIKYVWRGGKMVADVGDDAIERIETFAADTTIPTVAAAGDAASTDRKRNPQSLDQTLSDWRIYVAIVLVAIAGLLWWLRLKLRPAQPEAAE